MPLRVTVLVKGCLLAQAYRLWFRLEIIVIYIMSVENRQAVQPALHVEAQKISLCEACVLRTINIGV